MRRDRDLPHFLRSSGGTPHPVVVPSVVVDRFQNAKAWPEFVLQPHLDRENYVHFGQAQYRAAAPTSDAPGHCGESVSLIGGNRNFGHHIFESLTRLAVLDSVGDLHLRRLAFWRDVPVKFVEDFVPFFGVNASHIVRVDPGTFVDLYMPSCPIGRTRDKIPFIWPDALWWLRSKLIGRVNRDVPRRIYLPRYAPWRMIENEHDIRQLLGEYGFVAIDLAAMPVIDQVATVARADVIVMPAGASSPISIWADPAATIIELSNEAMDGIFGARLYAMALNTKLFDVRGQSIPTDSVAPRDWNYIVPIDRLRQILSMIGSVYSIE